VWKLRHNNDDEWMILEGVISSVVKTLSTYRYIISDEDGNDLVGGRGILQRNLEVASQEDVIKLKKYQVDAEKDTPALTTKIIEQVL
jgi:hypothetical protein